MVENTFRDRCGSPFGGVLVVLDFRAELDESFSLESGIVGARQPDPNFFSVQGHEENPPD
jgi:hypothetical protein